MGQINLPLLNRTGNSIFWNSLWDNKYSFSKNFKKNVFLKNILLFILNDRILYNSFFISKKFDKLQLEKQNTMKFKITNFLDNSAVYFNLLANKNLPFFHNKVWYIKYQNWLLITLFIYNVVVSHLNLNDNQFKKFIKFYNFFYFLKVNSYKNYENYNKKFYYNFL